MSPTSIELAHAAFQAIAHPILICDADNKIIMANYAAQDFFSTSESRLKRQRVDDLVAPSSPLLNLLDRVRGRDAGSREHRIPISNINMPEERLVDAHATPMTNDSSLTVMTLIERTMADKIDKQLTARGAARSVIGLAAMLAHEIKNPLSGIKGAAQLLEQSAEEKDQPLARLVQEEVARIVKLVDRMEEFGDERQPEFTSVNIHEVLNHVELIAQNGFAKGTIISKHFDPSLPPVLGNWDQLVQIYLNLFKNAAEAISNQDKGEIVVRTAYRPGISIGIPGSGNRLSLPLEICVEDNGGGISEDMLPHIFDPFVTSKQTGGGLGLALVAKLVGVHGGIVDADSHGGRTIMRTLLPVAKPKRNKKKVKADE
ncbi:two-component system sensor histidine kinase NtrB [Maritalea sp. S77]|uniref:two-component system sensor histidine kinase NtrB n=1 Tax=Maritalea sp. S77 TaxID=3415125 RepID=UPI003C7A7F6A